MVRVNNKLWYVFIGLLFVFACRDEFEINHKVEDTVPILVVEGYINAGKTESHYKLSYTSTLDESQGTGQLTMPNAVIVIESERGEKYFSQKTSDKNWVIRHPVLDAGQKYRLRIEVGDDVYESDFVEVKVSAEIGELEWAQTADGVEIYVNTEDPSKNSRYYRWEYEETWIYYSKNISMIVLDGNEVRYRRQDELIHSCFMSQRSSAIKIATSEELSTDAIYRFPLALIPNLSEKLTNRYSVLVRQIPMTQASYLYWQQLRESSENLGDVFGPMPSELNGNIVCITNPDNHVIGMVEAVNVAEKRLYINKEELEGLWRIVDPYYGSCMLSEAPIREAVSVVMQNPTYLLVNEIYANQSSPFPTDYSYSARRCVDCRVKGGQFAPPDFWQQ